MTVRSHYLLPAAMMLGMALPLAAKDPGPLGMERSQAQSSVPASSNQKMADDVAAHLRQSGQLRGYHIDIACRDGAVELRGCVADAAQRDAVLRIARAVPGVGHVNDQMLMVAQAPVTQAQAMLPPPQEMAPVPRQVPDAPAPQAAPMPAPMRAPAYPMEPVPIYQTGGYSPYDLNPPKMPPYAWPTYAPYNNYSRVAYPQAYPYNVWPFIGPVYPFPKVPLGWRSVKLVWEDGYWWFSKTATHHDWWRIRYW